MYTSKQILHPCHQMIHLATWTFTQVVWLATQEKHLIQTLNPIRNLAFSACYPPSQGEQSNNLRELLTDSHEKWLDFQKIKAFPAMVANPTLRGGARALMQVCT